jgi:large subunit ribosomal protein L20
MLRRLWNTNINASTQEFGVKYSQFMQGLALAGVQINRKVLSELARTEPLSMRSIVECSTSARKQFAEEYDEQALLDDLMAEKLPTEYFDFEKVADVAAYGTDAIDPREEMKSAQISRILDEQARETAAEDEIYEQRLIEEMKKKKIPESERTKSWSL